MAPAGSEDVPITINGGSSGTDNVFYYGAVVTGLKPLGGSAGTKVKISGYGFGTTPTVNWGEDHPITARCSTTILTDCIQSSSATAVTVVAPEGTEDVPITVDGGTGVKIGRAHV